MDTRWFHSTGIVATVGEHTATKVAAALKAENNNGAFTSDDLNFRSTLWTKEAAQEAMKRIMPYVDVIIGNEEDFGTMLGIKVEGMGANYAKID